MVLLFYSSVVSLADTLGEESDYHYCLSKGPEVRGCWWPRRSPLEGKGLISCALSAWRVPCSVAVVTRVGMCDFFTQVTGDSSRCWVCARRGHRKAERRSAVFLHCVLVVRTGVILLV